jgi:hypothetical protein
LTAEPSGLRIDPATAAGRAAWGSLGFLLRGVAADLLDVGPDEIEVGVSSLKSPDGLAHGMLFLADSLENGAGYARWLHDHLDKVLDAADTHAEALRRHATSEGQPCDSSCYQCLRDYRNSRWHPLLDWRLARDLLDLLRGRGITPVESWEGLEAVAGAVARDFGFESRARGDVPTLVNPRNGRTLALAHPFQDRSSHHPATELIDLVLDPSVVIATWFDLVRRPGLVAGQLMGI